MKTTLTDRSGSIFRGGGRVFGLPGDDSRSRDRFPGEIGAFSLHPRYVRDAPSVLLTLGFPFGEGVAVHRHAC